MLRATLKSMLSRKLRLVLSMLAVVLGVMFVSGAFVLTDTIGRSFDGLFTDVYSNTEIQVSKVSEQAGLNGQPVPVNLPAADVARVQSVPGVAKAVGTVFTDGAKLVDKRGKVVLGTGGPRFGGGWTGEDGLVEVRSGRPPGADNEIMLSANLAASTGYKVGDTVQVLTNLAPKKESYRVVGIAGYTGGRDTLAGETTIFFTVPVAQQLMLGETGVFNAIDVKTPDGTDLNPVRDRIKGVLGDGYAVQTGEELAKESSDSIKQGLSFFTYLLLGFAGIALFVGVFLILNTFSIIVAQRTRELALFRAMGANRGQVINSVLTEAVVIGVLSSVIGLLLGIGVGAGLGALAGSALSGGTLELAGLGVPLSAVIAAFAVGLGVTVVAALMPAIRASRIPPVAAMRDVATPDRPLTVLTVAGLVVLALGGTVLGLGLTGKLGGAGLSGVLGGLIVSFIGVALLTPIISRPVVALLGKIMSWNASGQLGRRNSARNPRRTAITAAALMVSIALVTAISVIFSSVQASTVDAIDQGLDAELVIAADPLSGGLGAIDPDTLQRVRDLSAVSAAAGIYADAGQINGQQDFLSGVDDVGAAVTMFRLETTAGSLQSLDSGQSIVDDKTAADRGLHVGSTFTVRMARAPEPKTITVSGIYKRTSVLSGIYLSGKDVSAGFSNPAPIQAFVALNQGSNVDAVYAQVQDILKDSPEVNVSKLDDYVAAQARIFDFILVFVQLLLGLAMIIAVLGIINTLALSMTERTRELGLLRAVGMKRGQLMWMITVESVVISVFGALLGIAVGVGLGVSVFQALRDDGFTTLAFPWPLMAGYVVASVVVGLAAALIPAVRAARLDVLKAIAYE
jgi:putative ABC transport system permease protein